MTNPMFNPQPNYSGVTIQIANPAVYAGTCDGKNLPYICGGGVNNGVNSGVNGAYNQVPYSQYPAGVNYQNTAQPGISAGDSDYANNVTNPIQNNKYPNSYPAQYYLNNYNYGITGDGNTVTDAIKYSDKFNDGKNVSSTTAQDKASEPYSNAQNQSDNNVNSYKMYANASEPKDNDMTKSQNIIGDIAEREAEIAEEKKNTKETKIVALTDEYIKSLENYLNNPNDEIRLMASKEILTRLDEDKDRYDDAALNALLNKMLQDPNKLVRIASLSAFASQLASGNDYTVQLLHNIQSNPNSDKEDVLQAADILLKMSAGVEVKNIPNPSVKDKEQ